MKTEVERLPISKRRTKIMNLSIEKTVKTKPEKAEKRMAAYDRLLTQKENEKKEEAEPDYFITI